MSQNSTTSTSSFFRPINSDDGDNERNGTPTPTTTRLDKQVSAVSSLQANASMLNIVVDEIDKVLDSINAIVFNGKRNVVSKLKTIQSTVSIIRSSIDADALVLSPIPSMAYANNRNNVEQRRTVSPEATLDAFRL